MKRWQRVAIASVLYAGWAPSTQAKPVPAWIFTNGAVLQRERPVPVWGSADPGEAITVTIAGADGAVIATARTTADGQGKWLVRLPSMHPGGPFSLAIAGTTTVTLTDILVGDVWICSGQSNMEWKLSASTNGKEAIAASAIPGLRLLTVPRDPANAPRSTVGQRPRWVASAPETTPDFSGVAFYFGRQLRQDLNVPIGLIHSSVGGTAAELWTALPGLKSVPSLQSILLRYDSTAAKFPAQWADFRTKLDAWYAASIVSESAGTLIAPPPSLPSDPRSNTGRPSALYNGMIAPVIPYAITGAIWYQGEANTGRAHQYRDLLPAMIQSWRTAWGQGDFPFLIVQLPNIASRTPAEPWTGSTWAELREAQFLTTRALPNTGLAVAIDVGGDLHPTDKLTVGHRLALTARTLAYGEKNVASSGPVYTAMQIKGNTVRLQFDLAGGGALVAKGGTLNGFTIAGEDRRFMAADARIDGNDIVVSAAGLSKPQAVRYAWADDPAVSLYNAAGLPAAPFRTDNWPGITETHMVESDALPLHWGKGINVLVLGGGSSHDFQKWFNTEDLATLRELKGPYTLHYTEQVDVAVAELPKVDVFITSTNQGDFKNTPMREALFRYIAAGKSAIFLHPAVWYNYRDWPEYNLQLIGGGSTGHDAFGRFQVKVDQPTHPIMKGVPADFEINDELYHSVLDPAGTASEVLATAITPSDHAKTYPSIWIVKHPTARIVCIALGHDENAHGHPAYKTVLKNALVWVSKK